MNNATTLCQTCRDVPVTQFLSLGMQPACDFPDSAAESETQQQWPLELGFCPQCSLVQVMTPVSERILFSGDYHHMAGLTGGYREHLRELADELAKRDATRHGPDAPPRKVVEVGSNDGSLLDELSQRDFDVLGVDPCGLDSPGGSPVVTEYFSSELARNLASTRGPADILVANNTFAHVTDLHDFLDGVREILGDTGMFVSESGYLPDLLEDLQYEFAYHEHSRYYSLIALDAAFAMHGLEVFDIEHIETHGGSIRVYAGFTGANEVRDSVAELRAYEDKRKLTDLRTYQKFAARVAEHRDRLRDMLHDLASDGSRVAAASAPARAVTLLNYCSLGADDVDFVSEISPRKIGKFLPGTSIPIVDQAELCGPDQPAYAVLMSWHIADEVISRLRHEGFTGKFVLPLPEPQVVG